MKTRFEFKIKMQILKEFSEFFVGRDAI